MRPGVVAAVCVAFALTACAGSDDPDPEPADTVAADEPDATDPSEPPAEEETPPEPTHTDPPAGDDLTVPETCSADVMAMLETFAEGEPVSNIPPDELDADLVCTFLGGEGGLGNGLGAIVSADEPIDWSQLGPVEPSEVTVGEFTGRLATLTGAGRALVVDLGGVNVTVNAGQDSVATDEDMVALAELVVQSVVGG